MKIFMKVKHELNYLKKEDFFQIPVFIISLLPAFFYYISIRVRKKRIWLISEDRKEARDNGFCFFKYINGLNECGIDTYYAIDYSSKDFEKVKEIGRTVKYGSVKHWMLYLCAEYVISSQKDCRPGTAIGYVIERLHLIKQRNIFLQHGITKDKAQWLFYKNTLMKMFICGAFPEYEYVKKFFGYPEDHVKYLGFSRFDDYHDLKVNKNQILLMPSWREWIGSKNEFSDKYEDTSVFKNTEYFQKYQSLITNEKLKNFLEENGLILYFYPHRNMQKFITDFKSNSKNIIIADSSYDIRQLLMESVLMITDYSSVALDFAYMKKNVIFYQFDEKRFREAQYEEGYLKYRECGFGKVYTDESSVIEAIEKLHKNEWRIDDLFLETHKYYFPKYDDKNSERIFNTLYGRI